MKPNKALPAPATLIALTPRRLPRAQDTGQVAYLWRYLVAAAFAMAALIGGQAVAGATVATVHDGASLAAVLLQFTIGLSVVSVTGLIAIALFASALGRHLSYRHGLRRALPEAKLVGPASIVSLRR